MVHHCSVPDWPVNKDLLWWLKSTAGNKHPCHWISKTNAANRGCINKLQNIFTDHRQVATTKCYSSSSVFILITVSFISRRRRTAAHLMGKEKSKCVNFRQPHFIISSVCVPFNHCWKFWNCAENVATRQERGSERKGKERETRGRSEHAWKVSNAAREDLWEPLIPTLCARLPRCLEPGDWSHPPGSLRPLSPPPLQTMVCHYNLILPPVLCMKSTATHISSTCTIIFSP